MSTGRLASVFLITTSLAAALVTAPATATAKEVGCNTLVNSVRKTGEAPRVTINKSNQMVRVEAVIGHCFESIDNWSARTWVKISPVVVDKPPLLKPSSPLGTKRSPPVKTRQKRTLIEPALLRPRVPCDQPLKGLWKSGWYSIGGQPHWLDSVHTIDLDGDTRTDNIGFRFKTHDGPDVVMRYFAAPGQRTAKSFSALRLDSDSIIPRLCFGRMTFKRPLSNVIKQKPFELPNLELEAKTKRLERAQGGVKKDRNWILDIVLTIGVALLAIGGGLCIFRWCWRKTDDPVGEDEDENDDEDEGQVVNS